MLNINSDCYLQHFNHIGPSRTDPKIALKTTKEKEPLKNAIFTENMLKQRPFGTTFFHGNGAKAVKNTDMLTKWVQMGPNGHPMAPKVPKMSPKASQSL